jgi:hypothetical protein
VAARIEYHRVAVGRKYDDDHCHTTRAGTATGPYTSPSLPDSML